MFDRILGVLRESGLTEKQTEQTLGGMLRVIHEVRSEGEQFELDPRLRNYFEKDVALTDNQIERVTGAARRVARSLSDSNASR